MPLRHRAQTHLARLSQRCRRAIGAAAVLCFALTGASCSSTLEKNFYVSAINTSEEPLKAAIVVDDEVFRDEQGQPLLTPNEIRVIFKLNEAGTAFRTVKLGVRYIEMDDAGGIGRGLEEGDQRLYIGEPRHIYQNDPARHLFILRLNPNYVPE